MSIDEILSEEEWDIITIQQATERTVYAGPVEGTAIGNLVVQMLKEGEFDSLQDARDIIRKSFDIRVIK